MLNEKENCTSRERRIFKTTQFTCENNKAILCGKVEKNLEFDHQCRKEKFFQTRVIVKRLSETKDNVPVIIPEKLLLEKSLPLELEGKIVAISGQFRSFDDHSKGVNKLKLYVFAENIKIFEKEEDVEEGQRNINAVWFKGYICKPTFYRITPLGKEITDVVIAINRQNKKSDYIPGILWGKRARAAFELKPGDEVEGVGRIHSRKYFKRENPEEPEKGEWKEAYELSIFAVYWNL